MHITFMLKEIVLKVIKDRTLYIISMLTRPSFMVTEKGHYVDRGTQLEGAGSVLISMNMRSCDLGQFILYCQVLVHF